MINLKEENIRRAIWHIRRHLEALSNAQDTEHKEYRLFHLQTSIDCLERVVNDKNHIYIWIRMMCFSFLPFYKT